MAAKNGRTDPPLSKLLFDESYRFNFFQAVRLLERLAPAERWPVGRDAEPERETVRFKTPASLNFPPSQLRLLQRRKPVSEAPSETAADTGELPTDEPAEPGQPEMTVAFMGLTGPLGVLPHPYTELLIERIVRYRDYALLDFLDIFNHRMLSFFYRAWEKHHFPTLYESRREDYFTKALMALIGLGTRGLTGRLGLPDESLLPYAGVIAQRPHSASAIAALLSDQFGVQVQVMQCTGQWLELDDDSVSRLGQANSQLGVSTVMGCRVWDLQSKFRLRLGPLTFREMSNLLPVPGSLFASLTVVTRWMAGPEFDFDVQLVLKASEVRGCALTTRARHRPMLGWTTWLKTEPFDQDDDQVVLAVNN